MAKDYNTEQAWWDSYSIRVRDKDHPLFGQQVTYGRVFAEHVQNPYTDEITYYLNIVDHLISLFTITPTDRIIIAGCGFGYTIEAFQQRGYSNVWGIESSTWINTERDTLVNTKSGPKKQASDGILWVAEDLTGGPQLRNALRTMTGDDEFDWVIDEHVMDSHEDADHPQLIVGAEGILDRNTTEDHIIHMVAVSNPNQDDPDMNWKTLAEWDAVAPSHSWVNPVTWEVL